MGHTDVALCAQADISAPGVVVPRQSAPAVGSLLNWPDTGQPVHRTKVGGVPNFGKLNAAVWRSGQPSREGYALLAKQGLKTVVNLREEFPQDKELLPSGVRYIYIPIKDEHEPSAEQARAFIEAVSNPDNWPLLVHCHAGEGRAGVMSALVRCKLDKWNLARVMKEADHFRSSYIGLVTIPMAACQRRFIAQCNEYDILKQKQVAINRDEAVVSAAPQRSTGRAEGAGEKEEKSLFDVE